MHLPATFTLPFSSNDGKISTLQDKQGFWHSSLLDIASYPMPETSSSAFFTYSLFWGINRGYLEKEKYLSIAEKAWHALTSIVHEDGKVGYVQPIGADPKKVDIMIRKFMAQVLS